MGMCTLFHFLTFLDTHDTVRKSFLMKKFLGIVALGLVFSWNVCAASSYKWNTIYQGGEYKLNKINFNLPEGDWLLLSVNDWDIKGISLREIIYVKEKDNLFTDIYEVSVLNSYGQFISSIDNWMYGVFFSRNQADGCFEKDEYYVLRRLKQGASLNCFTVFHDNVNKEIWHPESNPNGLTKSFNNSWVRKWVSDKKIILPKTMLTRSHAFYHKSSGMHIVLNSHSINPEFYGAQKTKFQREEESEYHKFNIEKYPEAKIYMENFIKNAAIKHKQFENNVKAKEYFKLDLNEFDIYKKEKVEVTNISNIAEQLETLSELYKSGILTKEEFAKAKNKILK